VKLPDGSVSKLVIRACESHTFAASFAESLRNAPPADAAALRKTLQITQKDIREGVKGDVTSWCEQALEPHIRSGTLFNKNGTFTQCVSAMDGGLNEVTAQGLQSMQRLLDDIKASANASRFTQRCAAEVGERVRTEVRNWEATAVKAPARTEAVGDLKTRLSKSVAPLFQELHRCEEEIAAAQESSRGCRRSVELLEQAAAHATAVAREPASSSRSPPSFSAAAVGNTGDWRAATADSLEGIKMQVLGMMASGRSKEALERALGWDAKNQAADISLMELALDQYVESASDDAFIALTMRSELAAQLDGRLKLLVTFALLQRSVVHAATVSRVDDNLAWIQALLDADTVDTNDKAFMSGLEGGRQRMQATLEGITRCEAPPALAQAPQQKRRAVVLSARTALKSLTLLARIRP